MLKKYFFIILIFSLSFLTITANAQIPIPNRIGGTLTINGIQITSDNDEGYVFTITNQDNSDFNPKAQDTDGLNSYDRYFIDVPLYHQTEQPQGAVPGSPAVLHVHKEGTELTITSPAKGEITIESEGTTSIINIEAVQDSSMPVADAGEDQSVNSGAKVILDGSKSSVYGGSIQYKWEQIEGISVTLSNTESVQASFNAPEVNNQTDLVFKLTVFDSDNKQNSDTIKIIVNAVIQNNAPIASAGEDKTVNAGEKVMLDGSGSYDQEGEITYLWEQIQGEFVDLSNAIDVKPVFTAPLNKQDLIFRLTITDAQGLKSSDEIAITIQKLSEPNQAPIANAGADHIVHQGDEVILDGSNSIDPDNGPGNGIVSYLWTQLDGIPVNLSNYTIAKPAFTAPGVDSGGSALTFELIVKDKFGMEGNDQVTVNIISENQPPTADAGQDITTSAGEYVTLNGSNSSDPDNDPLIYNWIQVSGPQVILSDNTIANPSFTAVSVESGGASLKFELTVQDNKGLKHTDHVSVNIVADNPPPDADAGPDQTVQERTEVILDGSGSADLGNDIVLYIWSQKMGSTPVTLSDAKSINPRFTAPDVGPEGELIIFELTVIDSHGLQSTDDVSINITFAGTHPVADAGFDKTIDEGSTGILDGSKSYAPYSEIISYQWRQTGGPEVIISNPLDIKTTFQAPGAENDNIILIFELMVKDRNEVIDTDEVVISINDFGAGPGADDGSCFIKTLPAF